MSTDRRPERMTHRGRRNPSHALGGLGVGLVAGLVVLLSLAATAPAVHALDLVGSDRLPTGGASSGRSGGSPLRFSAPASKPSSFGPDRFPVTLQLPPSGEAEPALASGGTASAAGASLSAVLASMEKWSDSSGNDVAEAAPSAALTDNPPASAGPGKATAATPSSASSASMSTAKVVALVAGLGGGLALVLAVLLLCRCMRFLLQERDARQLVRGDHDATYSLADEERSLDDGNGDERSQMAATGAASLDSDKRRRPYRRPWQRRSFVSDATVEGGGLYRSMTHRVDTEEDTSSDDASEYSSRSMSSSDEDARSAKTAGYKNSVSTGSSENVLTVVDLRNCCPQVHFVERANNGVHDERGDPVTAWPYGNNATKEKVAPLGQTVGRPPKLCVAYAHKTHTARSSSSAGDKVRHPDSYSPVYSFEPVSPLVAQPPFLTEASVAALHRDDTEARLRACASIRSHTSRGFSEEESVRLHFHHHRSTSDPAFGSFLERKEDDTDSSDADEV